ncbi:MAG: 50S ribosomal protein L10 [Actinomycetota bacterium]
MRGRSRTGPLPSGRAAPRPELARARHTRRWVLNRDEKAAVVAEIVDRLTATETVIAADFRGMTVKELAGLRTKLRGADAGMTVVKNTLARRAADETGRAALLPYLTGPSGLVWAAGDPAQAAKILADTAKAVGGRMTLKGGVMGQEDLPAEAVQRLAALPSRDVLLAQLAGGVAAPLTGLAGALNNMIGGLARALGALHEQRAGEAQAA